MNKELEQFARQRIKEGLAKCTDDERMIFTRMYSPKNLSAPIGIVVDGVPVDRLDWAMTQVSNTLDRRE
jgi:hypothetical protein